MTRHVQIGVTSAQYRDVQWALDTDTPITLAFDAPSTVEPDGTRTWRDVSGRLHRLGAPAVIRPDGRREWWLDGVRLPCDDTRRAN